MSSIKNTNNPGNFEDTFMKVASLRNAIIRHLQSNGAYIKRIEATESELSFDNLVLRIIEMAEWEEK